MKRVWPQAGNIVDGIERMGVAQENVLFPRHKASEGPPPPESALVE